jgi:hypothetical protein
MNDLTLTAKQIARYKKKSQAQLMKIAVKWCHKYIRLRDEGKDCICCPGKYGNLQAGHFYPAGFYPNLKFNEYNIHGQRLGCNYHKHGNTSAYRQNIVNRIGQEKLEELDKLAANYKRNGWKWNRFYIISVIEEYKRKVKEL